MTAIDTVDLTDPETMAAVERCVLWHLPADETLQLGPVCHVHDRGGCLLMCFEAPERPGWHYVVVWAGFAVCWLSFRRTVWHHHGRALAPDEVGRYIAHG